MLHTLRSIGVNCPNPVRILVDNEGAFKSASIPGIVLKKRHSSIAYNKAREAVASGIVDFYWIKSNNNIADVLTKPLGRATFQTLLSTFMFGFNKGEFIDDSLNTK
jgi:hypothetical protein